LELATNPLARLLLQFKRKTLGFAALAALLGIALAGVFNPTHAPGAAIALAVSASVLASLIVAAIALERAAIADDFTAAGVMRIFVNRKKDIPDEAWARLLAGVHDHFKVLGTSSHGYLNDSTAKEDTEQAIRKALTRPKVTVEFLWLNPESQLAKIRESEEGVRALVSDTCEAIAFFYDLAASLPPEQAERVSLRVYKSLPTCGITWADDYLIVTHYLAGRLNLRAPGLILNANEPLLARALGSVWPEAHRVPPLAQAYMKNYSEVASEKWSEDVDAASVQKFRDLYAASAGQTGKRSEAELRREDPSDDDPDTGGHAQDVSRP
jgi:hypothetical protein